MNKRWFVYIAGPISRGNTIDNIRSGIDAGEAVLRAGMIPYIPHLDTFWHLIYPKEYEDWLDLDFKWIDRCDAVLRIPGESPGADREVAHAQNLHIPVFHTIESLIAEEAATRKISWIPIP